MTNPIPGRPWKRQRDAHTKEPMPFPHSQNLQKEPTDKWDTDARERISPKESGVSGHVEHSTSDQNFHFRTYPMSTIYCVMVAILALAALESTRTTANLGKVRVAYVWGTFVPLL